MAFGVGVDQDFDARKCVHQRLLHFIHDAVRRGYGHIRVNPDMELAEIMRAAGTGAHVMYATQLRMAQRDINEALPFFFRPFAVQQLIQCNPRRAIGAP